MNSNPMYMEYVDDEDVRPSGRRRGWRVLGWVSIGLSVVMVAGSLTAYAVYRSAFGNITTEDTDALLGPNRPKKLNSALNILVLGSDTRAGAGNAKYGRSMTKEPPRADTMILLHLSPGGGQALGISFPRDLMVPIPSCKLPSGRRTSAMSVGQINSAFTFGGASCTVKTIENFTNVKIDHFVQIDFNGFKKITKAVGGVPVCIPRDVNDAQSELRLKRGTHVISGETALAYVRTRKGLGDGSDTDRIKRQQKFMSALANKAMSKGVLTDPKQLLALVNATTESLTTDKELNTQAMMKIASGMQDLTSGKLRFVTVPWGAYAPDANRVALRQPDAAQLFAAIRNDKTVPTQSKQPAAAPKIPANQVRVRVYNASGRDGLAGRVVDDLKSQGFHASIGGTIQKLAPKSRVLYGTGADQHAQTVNALLTNPPQPGLRPKGMPGMVDLVIGTDWTSLKGAASGGIPAQQGEVKGTDPVCAK